MAHSPEKNAANSEIIRYDLGWNAINSMLRAGRSLSGHERNCCFLNSGGDRFADVSSAAGLDFDDDGRVLALADWDYDGDVDFWVANRSGPQVRYLENRLGKDNRFLAIRLQGVQCNRDAIGAKVSVTSHIKGESVTQSQTLKAGEGYLSQNSKWLHFGLGDASKVDRVEITWPHGDRQSFDALEPNQWLRIREGDEQPTSWKSPTAKKLIASEFKAPLVSDQARIVLLNPIPMPTIRYHDRDGHQRSISESADRPRLVNLWATWCQPCVQELAEWKRHAAEIASAGIDVLAINVDEQSADREATVEGALNALALPFATGDGSEELVTQFDVLQRSLLSRQRPLPVPSSFLIDGEGRLCVVYKGPVDVQTLLQDASLVDAEPKRILVAATPFKGRWLNPPGGSTPLQLAVKYAEGGLVDETLAYIESLIERRDRHPHYVSASIMNVYGAALLDQKKFKRAISAFEESLELDPDNRQAHIELGTILLGGGRGDEAVAHFQQVLKANASDPELLYKLGVAQLQRGNLAEAKKSLQQSLQLRPNANGYWQLGNVAAQMRQARTAVDSYGKAIALNPSLQRSANNLAWLLATSHDGDLRDGHRALEIANEICDQPGKVSPSSLDTLAAALAETGDFVEAVKIAEQALRLARESANEALASRIESRAELYRSRKPFRESF